MSWIPFIGPKLFGKGKGKGKGFEGNLGVHFRTNDGTGAPTPFYTAQDQRDMLHILAKKHLENEQTEKATKEQEKTEKQILNSLAKLGYTNLHSKGGNTGWNGAANWTGKGIGKGGKTRTPSRLPLEPEELEADVWADPGEEETAEGEDGSTGEGAEEDAEVAATPAKRAKKTTTDSPLKMEEDSIFVSCKIAEAVSKRLKTPLDFGTSKKAPVPMPTLIKKIKNHAHFQRKNVETAKKNLLGLTKLLPTANLDSLIRSVVLAELAKNGHLIARK